MDFRIKCPCGLSITVSEAAAGGEARCACGQMVRIPEWTELRERAGLPRYNLSPELVIENFLIRGEVPFDDKCVKCEEPTDQLVRVLTKCERGWVQQTGGVTWLTALMMIFSPVIVFQRREERSYGRDKIYSLPLRICPACLATIRTRDDVKHCLRAVPVYNLLLDKFPDAEVSISRG
jgi:hypothetical protein